MINSGLSIDGDVDFEQMVEKLISVWFILKLITYWCRNSNSYEM